MTGVVISTIDGPATVCEKCCEEYVMLHSSADDSENFCSKACEEAASEMRAEKADAASGNGDGVGTPSTRGG